MLPGRRMATLVKGWGCQRTAHLNRRVGHGRLLSRSVAMHPGNTIITPMPSPSVQVRGPGRRACQRFVNTIRRSASAVASHARPVRSERPKKRTRAPAGPRVTISSSVGVSVGRISSLVQSIASSMLAKTAHSLGEPRPTRRGSGGDRLCRGRRGQRRSSSGSWPCNTQPQPGRRIEAET